MLLKPKDAVRKFGFNGPVGLYITNCQFKFFKITFVHDLEEFINYCNSTEEVINYEEYFNNTTDLTDKEIRGTWEDETPLKDFIQGYFLVLAEMRGLYEASANNCTRIKDNSYDGEFKDIMKDINRYSFWKKNYKKL